MLNSFTRAVVSQDMSTTQQVNRRDAREWPRKKKIVTTWVVSMFKFISGLTSTSIVPNLGDIALDLGISSGVLKIFPLSTYFLGYTVGLLMIGPLSETFGRVGMLQASNAIFIIFNTAGGFSQTTAQMIVMRVLSGFGAAGPLSLGGGILHDCFTPEERTSMITIYTLPAQLSPAIGPILGAICEQYLDWRWTFWIVSIVSVALQVVCFAVVQETYKPALERRWERSQRNKEEGRTIFASMGEVCKDVTTRLRTNMLRPLRMLATHGIVQLLALYNGVTYGLQFLVISSLDHLWTGPYQQSVVLGSLNYLALAAGLVIGAQICRPLNKSIGARLKEREPDGQSKPEFRIPMIAAGSTLVPVGLLWYGWAAEYLAFPLVTDLGVFVFAMGIITILNCTSLYLVDTYKQSSASATGAVSILRALCGFAFPLFSAKIYETLGHGKGNTVLAALSIALGWPMPLILWRYGSKIREKQIDV